MDAKLYFGKVHIVEWLRPGDRRTGAGLLDELEPLGIVSKSQVLTQLHRVATRADLLGVLRRIEGEFRATARLPVLHIETHGNYDGIGVLDGDAVIRDGDYSDLTGAVSTLFSITRCASAAAPIDGAAAVATTDSGSFIRSQSARSRIM